MTHTVSDQIGASGFLARACGLAPLVDVLRPRFDRERQLPAELVTALGDAGFFGMWLPRALGGPELDPLSFLEVIEALCRLDGSVGWCTTIAAGYGRLAAALDPGVAREMFGAGRGILVGTLNATGKAVAVPGGYRVTGKWGYGSFIAHGDWVLGNCITHDPAGARKDAGGGPELRLAIFPRAETEVTDVWQVGGLRGTGSNDFAVADLFVPAERTIPLPGFFPVPRHPGALYALPMTSTFVSCIATTALGIARAALDAFGEIAAGKITTGSQTVLRERPMVQAETAQAEATLRAGRAYLFDELGRMWNDAQAGRPISLLARAHVRLAACHATKCAIETVDRVYALAGGASLFEGNRLERCFRDIHAAGQHIAVAPLANLEIVGKALFGLDPGVARF